MNAYELADKLQMDKAKALVYVDTVVQSAEMLRQQADRIAELEKFNKAILKKGGYPHKPLSDEEIDSIIYSVDWAYDPVLLARAIEERHGIK